MFQGVKSSVAGFAAGIILASGAAYAITQVPNLHAGQGTPQVQQAPESTQARQAQQVQAQQAVAATQSPQAQQVPVQSLPATGQPVGNRTSYGPGTSYRTGTWTPMYGQNVAPRPRTASPARICPTVGNTYGSPAGHGYTCPWNVGTQGASSGSYGGNRMSSGWTGGCR